MAYQLHVCLEDIRSAHNVGSVFRTCDSAGVDTLYLTGRSAHPPHPKLEKTALGSSRSVNWQYHPDINILFPQLKAQGITLVCLETTPQATSIFDTTISSDTCLIFGNEVSGISPNTLKAADQIIHIPHFGAKESLNVSIAAGIAIYEFKRKILSQSPA